MLPHTPRRLVAGQVHLPPEVELSTCPGCPGWKAYSNQMFTRGRQPVPQLQGLPFYCTSGAGGWRLQVPVGGGGGAGSASDAQIFKHTDLRHKIEDGSICFPDSESLGTGAPKVNFFILGDDTFPLKIWLMRPYSSHGMDLKERFFNYRISRGRRMVENAFGIPMSHFRIFQSPLQQEPPMVNRVVMACLILHNLLRIRYPTAQREDFQGQGQRPIVLEGNNIPYDVGNAIGAAKRQRHILREYFMNDGQVPGTLPPSAFHLLYCY